MKRNLTDSINNYFMRLTTIYKYAPYAVLEMTGVHIRIKAYKRVGFTG